MAITAENSNSPYASPPSSPVSDVPTSPDTNPPITTSEAIYGRLNVLQTNFRRLARVRDALKKRIDNKLEAHNFMFASRAFTMDYKVALTKHLNDFLEPLYNDLEETEVQLEEADAGMTHIFRVLEMLENQHAANGPDTKNEKKKTVVEGCKKDDGDDGYDSYDGADTDVDTDVDTEVDSEEEKDAEEDQNDEVV
ncbi:hypothetical protein B9Z19DRAFT_1122240 [Tuber borchii]|uniref:Uncharacterized protein n=1 Tax=Tuber borchii TaxID=42251 RepID=A0A2T7A0U1_TUBBO|nr:hypothetical protein B9Z19DRAFT_1122240 [Tuber borchii]